MATYCTTDQLSRWGISADALARVNVQEMNDAIGAASDLIDSYLRSRYTLPLASFGQDISRACAIISVYDLIHVRGYRPDRDSEDVSLETRYKDVLAWLKMISTGDVTPDVVGGGGSSGTSIGAPMVSSCEQRGYFTTSSTASPFTRRRG